jgi:hypothetical protein
VLAERIMRVKAMPTTDDRRRELVQKTLLGSLNRAKEMSTGKLFDGSSAHF